MNKIVIAVMFLLASFAPRVMLAQMSSSADPNLIDGSVHPEAIADTFAYRSFFELAAHSTARPKAQDAVFNSTGLNTADQAQLLTAIVSFRSAEVILIQNYNAAVAAADAASPGQPPASAVTVKFWKDMVELVNSTRATLNSTLSVDGVTQLNTHVQNLKKGMHVSAGAV